MKYKLVIIFVILTIAALWVTPAFGAQGQITEVTPSGTGTVVILQADEGDEEGFRPGRPGEINRKGSAGNRGTPGHFASQCTKIGACQ